MKYDSGNDQVVVLVSSSGPKVRVLSFDDVGQTSIKDKEEHDKLYILDIEGRLMKRLKSKKLNVLICLVVMIVFIQ